METYEVRDILRRIYLRGTERTSRNQTYMELDYFQGIIDNPWSMYPSRKYNIDYFKREFQWYLGADPYDHRIAKFAKMWGKIIQPDGQIFSNYGFYWFGPQKGMEWVIDTLHKDPDSRQAYIPMCNYNHIYRGNPDVVCTKGIQFKIRNGIYLDMHVSMRSSDAIYGLGTDLPCFYFLWMMIASELCMREGRFVFSADSVHVYKKHYGMMERIVKNNETSIPPVHPFIDDADDLIFGRYESDFGKWLREVNLDEEDNQR